MEYIELIGSVAGYIITIVTCLTLLIKPLREKVLGIKRQRLHEEEIENQKTEKDLCLLRHNMKSIYNTYCSAKKIPEMEYIDFITHFCIYKQMNGNLFVDDLFNKIKNWDVIYDGELPTESYYEAMEKLNQVLKGRD